MSVAQKFIKRFETAISKLVNGLRTTASYLTPADDWVEQLRRRVLLFLHPFADALGRPLIREAHDRDYMYTVAKDSDTVERALHPQYQRNLSSTKKYRMLEGDRQWASGSWVYDPEDTDWQHHVYLFDEGSYNESHTAIYGHKEASVDDPSEHTSGGQIGGDPDENVVPLLAEQGITRLD